MHSPLLSTPRQPPPLTPPPYNLLPKPQALSRQLCPRCPGDPAADAALGMLGRQWAGRVAAPPPGCPAPRKPTAQHLAAPGRGRSRRGAALRVPEPGPNFPPPLSLPGVQSLDRELRRRRPGRRAEFLEGGARGCPPYGLLGHLVPSGRGEPRSRAGERPPPVAASPPHNSQLLW